MVEARLDLAALVNGLDERQFAELWDVAQSRKRFEKYGARTIEGLLDKWGMRLFARTADRSGRGSTGRPPTGPGGTGAANADAGSAR